MLRSGIRVPTLYSTTEASKCLQDIADGVMDFSVLMAEDSKSD